MRAPKDVFKDGLVAIGRCSAAILFLVLSLHGSLSAGKYYIALTGSNSNNGSITSPWATIMYAVAHTSPGDSILIRGGTYPFQEEIWLQNAYGHGGTADHLKTIMAFPGETVALPQRFLVDANYVRIKGLTFNHGAGLSAVEWDSPTHHVEFLNNYFTGAFNVYSGAINYKGSNGLIEGNQLLLENTGSTTDHGIYVMTGKSNIIRNNFVSGTPGYGIQVYDESKDGYVAHIENVIIENNMVTGSYSRSGIIISIQQSSDPFVRVTGVKVHNNILINNAQGGISLSYGRLRDIEIFNNVIYNNAQGGVGVFSTNTDSLKIINNAFSTFRSGNHIYIGASIASLMVTHNLYDNPPLPGAGFSDLHPLFANPLFVNPSNMDFHLQLTSPAIDAGLDIGLPFLGDAPDIGAFEFGESDIDIEPTSVNFEKVLVGESKTDSVRISNTGSANLMLTSLDLTGIDPASFSTKNSVPYTIAPASYQNLNINFMPSSEGIKTATLVVETDNPSATKINIPLSGSGVSPEIDINPASHDFGELEVDSTKSHTFELFNVGSADLQVLSTVLRGLNPEAFLIASGGAPFILTPGAVSNLIINFKPMNEGEKSSALEIESNDSEQNPLAVSLSGKGVQAKFPEISINETSFDFGEVDLDSTSSHTFELLNAGTADLQILSTELFGPDSTAFSIAYGDAPVTLPPGVQHDLIVTFLPPNEGEKISTLRIESNDTLHSPLSIALIGTGHVAEFPELSISETSFDFGEVNVDSTRSHVFRISNTGTGELGILAANIIGPDSEAFSLNGAKTPFTLDPDSSNSITVLFAPGSPGLKSAVLQIRSNDIKNDSLNITLQGLGISITGLEAPEDILPTAFELFQNYPNPFNPETNITFQLPYLSQVTLTIYDLMGRKLTILVNKTINAGIHTIKWNGRDSAGRSVSSGIYIMVFYASSSESKDIFRKTRKMLLVF